MHTDNCISYLTDDGELTYNAPYDCTSPEDHENAPNRCPECGGYMNAVERAMGDICVNCVLRAHRKAVGK